MCHGTEAALLQLTVGHVQVETLGNRYIRELFLVFAAAHELFLLAQQLHVDARVSVLAFGLADVHELDVRLVLTGKGDDPGHRGERLHALRPVGGGQQGGGGRRRADSVDDGL